MRRLGTKALVGTLATAVALVGALATTTGAGAAGIIGNGNSQTGAGNMGDVYRLYNLYTGEHFYTFSTVERNHLMTVGWTYEGVAFDGLPDGDLEHQNAVYRLYNPYVTGGDHHYTRSKAEYEHLGTVGWVQEGISWYYEKLFEMLPVEVYRLYNPNATSGAHHYTTDADERDALVAAGWKDEGIGWWAQSGARSLLDGSQPEFVEAARKALGVPNDPFITYRVDEWDDGTYTVDFCGDGNAGYAWGHFSPDGILDSSSSRPWEE